MSEIIWYSISNKSVSKEKIEMKVYSSVSSHIQTPSRCWFPLCFPHELLMSLRCMGHGWLGNYVWPRNAERNPERSTFRSTWRISWSKFVIIFAISTMYYKSLIIKAYDIQLNGRDRNSANFKAPIMSCVLMLGRSSKRCYWMIASLYQKYIVFTVAPPGFYFGGAN